MARYQVKWRGHQMHTDTDRENQTQIQTHMHRHAFLCACTNIVTCNAPGDWSSSAQEVWLRLSRTGSGASIEQKHVNRLAEWEEEGAVARVLRISHQRWTADRRRGQGPVATDTCRQSSSSCIYTRRQNSRNSCQ